MLIQAGATLLVGLLVYGRNPDGLGPAAIPPGLIAIALPYVLLGYLAYSGTMLCIAAILPNLAENTQLQFFIRLASLMPMLGVVFILPYLRRQCSHLADDLAYICAVADAFSRVDNGRSPLANPPQSPRPAPLGGAPYLAGYTPLPCL